MSHGPLGVAVVYLAAAVIGVPIAKRLGLGSVLGYLLAGVVIGPHVIGLVGHDSKDVMHFAEFGVVMMLFLVGLELRPALLIQMRRAVLGLGGLQVVITALVISGLAIALGTHPKTALAIGLTLAMSSTAIVLQTLGEKSLLKTPGGQASFAVLLFQDIAVIPILAVFPLLALREVTTSTGHGRPAWQSALLVVLAVAVVIGIGRYLVRPLFRLLATIQLRETFTAAALLLVVAIALLMDSVGLSPALGTFLAGVVLADSEYRHELESDIEPFKGLLLGVFFITVGAQIDFGFVASQPGNIAGLVVATIVIKAVVLFGIGRVVDLDRPAKWLLALGMAQIGEFAFVLLSVGVEAGVFDEHLSKLLVAVVAISMALTPALFLILERFILARLASTGPERPQDEVHADGNPVIFAGHGRFGQIVGRMLRANGIGTTVLDLDPEMVDVLRRLGIKVYYGDASRLELLETAGARHAKLFVVAIDDKDAAVRLTQTLRHAFPKLKIFARARDRPHYFELVNAGADLVIRETFGSAYDMGVEAFRTTGMRAPTAHRRARAWRRHEEQKLGELSRLWGGDEKVYFDMARQAIVEAERLMADKSSAAFTEVERAWDNAGLRAGAGAPGSKRDVEEGP